MKFCINIFLFLLLSFAPAAGSPLVLSLKGYLGKEELAAAKGNLEAWQPSSTAAPLILDIDSSAGDLEQVLDLAKIIYERKVLHSLKVVAYIQGNAIGPAAIFPFLADDLYCSLFISWGDIPLGTEGRVPPNILRNRVRSLIDAKAPHSPLLTVLADAMSDPSMQVVNDQGWKIAASNVKPGETMISAPGQTLVVNQNQLQELGLVHALLPPAQFKAIYHFEESNASAGHAMHQSSLETIESKLQKSIHFHTDSPNTVGYIAIGDHEDAINQSTWLYVKQALDYYQAHKPIFIILELNTPGGEIFAAQKISDALKEMDTQFNIPIVAFIDNWAISAGAMLAYSCRFITTVKDGSMGAAEPVLAGEGGKMETASEKVNSALRADFANRASFFGRNPLIAEKMVDKDQILVQQHGKFVRLDNENQIKLTGPEVDTIISNKGKLLTLNAEQMIEYGVADLLLPPAYLSPITPKEKSTGRWPASKMLLFRAPFFSKIPQVTVDAYKMDWKTHLFVFLSSPLISSLLFMGLVVGGYIELNNPGLTLPGSIAAICLFLIILSSFSLQIAHWLELIILLTGSALIVAELFVLPTFGLLGVLGILLFIAGLFGMLLPGLSGILFEYDTHSLNAAGEYFIQRLGWLCGSLIMSVFIIALLARYVLPGFSGFNRFVLAGHEQEASKGYIAGENPIHLPQKGACGEVLATLRPAGKVVIGDQIYDAISTGGFIDAGEKIIVDRLEGSVIMVKPHERGGIS